MMNDDMTYDAGTDSRNEQDVYITDTVLTPENDPVKDQFAKGICLLALPLLLCLLCITVPVVFSLVVSFSKYNGISTFSFIGFNNYISIFSDRNFYRALGENLIYALNPLKYIIVAGVPLLFAFFLSRIPRQRAWIINSVMKLSVFAASAFSASLIIFLYFIIFFRNMRPDDGIVSVFIALADIFYGLSLALCFGIVFLRGLFNAQGLPEGEKTHRPVLRGTLALVLLSAAYTMQVFTPHFILKGGITQYPLNTIVGYLYWISMRLFRLGEGSALAFLLQLFFMGCGILLYVLFEKGNFVLYIRSSVSKNKTAPEGSSSKAMSSYIGIALIIIVLIGIFFVPAYQFFSTAFQPQQAYFEGKITLFPFNFSLENFKTLFANHSIFTASIVTTWIFMLFLGLVQTAVSLGAGYALGRYRFPGRKGIIFIIYAVFFITPALLFIPYFFFNRIFRLIDTFFIFLPLVFSPAGVIIFKTFFEGTRIDYAFAAAAAAATSNAGEQSALKTKISLDTIRMTAFVFVVFLVINMNEFILPLVNIFRRQNQVASLFLTFIRNEGQAFTGSIAAGNFLAYFPLQLICFVILFILGKNFLSGFVLFRRKSAEGNRAE